jgi:hypothetical protein
MKTIFIVPDRNGELAIDLGALPKEPPGRQYSSSQKGILTMRKILAAALLAATPACAGTISLTCARPTGSYKVQVDASTGAVTLLPAYGTPATFAGVPWVDDEKRLWIKAGFGTQGRFFTLLASLEGPNSVAWRFANGRIFREDRCW